MRVRLTSAAFGVCYVFFLKFAEVQRQRQGKVSGTASAENLASVESGAVAYPTKPLLSTVHNRGRAVLSGDQEHREEEIYDEAYVEHDGAKVLIAEILAGTPTDDFYDAKVNVLSEMIKHHVKEEEQRGGMFAQAQARRRRRLGGARRQRWPRARRNSRRR